MAEYTVRKMAKSDVGQIMKIESVSFGTHHWSEDAFMSEIDNQLGNYIVVLDSKGFLVGYGGFWLILEEAHITTIAVHPEFRKRRLGEYILQNLIDIGYKKEAKWFTLEVRASNVPAQALYHKYGFKSLGIRHGYYQDNGEDALIMWTENIWDNSFKSMFEAYKSSLTSVMAVS